MLNSQYHTKLLVPPVNHQIKITPNHPSRKYSHIHTYPSLGRSELTKVANRIPQYYNLIPKEPNPGAVITKKY